MGTLKQINTIAPIEPVQISECNLTLSKITQPSQEKDSSFERVHDFVQRQQLVRSNRLFFIRLSAPEGAGYLISTYDFLEVFREGGYSLGEQLTAEAKQVDRQPVPPITALVFGNLPFYHSLAGPYVSQTSNVKVLGYNSPILEVLFPSNDGLLARPHLSWRPRAAHDEAALRIMVSVLKGLATAGYPVELLPPIPTKKTGQNDGGVDYAVVISGKLHALSVKGSIKGKTLTGKDSLRSSAQSFFPTEGGQQRRSARRWHHHYFGSYSRVQQDGFGDFIHLAVSARHSKQDAVIWEHSTTRSPKLRRNLGIGLSLDLAEVL